MSLAWFVRRLMLMVYTVIVVSMLVFAITQILPADAAQSLLGENATPEVLAALRTRLGLGDPAWLQYGRWARHVFTGDFGISMRTSLPVGPEMLAALSRSLLLAVSAILVTLAIAVPLGVVAALRQGRLTDTGVSLIAYLGVSLPEFVTATLLALLLADT